MARASPVRQQEFQMTSLRGDQALTRLLEYDDVRTIVDVGSGDGEHARIMRAEGRDVIAISLIEPADVIGDFMGWASPKTDFDAIWACHVLEHQVDPGAFLRECRRRLRPGGYLVVTVPPMKHAIVGGHVALWNAGLLLYHLILAGFDCREARVGTYDYNVSVIVGNHPAELPALHCDHGDIERLAEWFPVSVQQGFDGRLPNISWSSEPVAPIHPAGDVPDHVCILGLGPSLEAYVDLVKRLGGRHAFCDEVWGINAVAGVVQCDRVFHMDDVRVQEVRAAARPDSNIARMLEWMRRHPGPIYTSQTHPDYPGLIAYPLDDVINSCGWAYFNSTAAYAVAYAIHIGVKKISMWGFDFTYANSHQAEKGRACVEFHLGIASERGIEIGFPSGTSLMDANAPIPDRLYGYDMVDLAFEDTGERHVVTMTPHDRLPSADAIEARYDHAKHPNPLVKG
ncbi:class I SAM-dependent methyltransferase [Mesorhizobium sp. M0768]|uniref:class I SAM-dependent methyltransferase n=1 Tax=Mesorhizobium sp. M0768 TaxID=2956996 RepID=UPI00333D73FE